MISAFGVDHGATFSKADSSTAPVPQKNGTPSGGRYAAGYMFGPFHGAVAGRKGKKLRAAGSQLGYSLGGTAAGTALGGAISGAAHGKAGLAAGSLIGTAGAVGGSMYGTRRNQRLGRYKPEATS